MDNVTGARRAVEHLIDQGYTKIGIITGPETWWESRQREAGWRSALLAAGRLRPAEIDRLRAVGDWYPSSGACALQQLLAQEPHLEAVFACNDPMALGALSAARQLGRRVPEQIAIAGYDDVPESGFFYPALTTVHQPLEEMGAEAVRMLHRALSYADNTPYPPEQVWLRPELVVRTSSIRPV
jgi:LacI family transcriptional regulator